MYQKYLPMLRKNYLFSDLTDREVLYLLKKLDARERSYTRNEIIAQAGERPGRIGIVLSGHVDLIQEDFWGYQVLIRRIKPQEFFADSYVMSVEETLSVAAISHRDSRVLYIDYKNILISTPENYPCQYRFITKLLAMIGYKNVLLLKKINILSKHTIRKRLMAYLSDEARMAGGNEFTISLDRQSLADYLAVDRSALSAELSQMQRDGLLSFKKNAFVLHAPLNPRK